VAVDEAHPLFVEPLVNLSAYGLAGENYYARTDGANAPYHRAIAGHINGLWARRSVAEKLVRVNRRLQGCGFRLFIWDAYRPPACQQGLWDFWWERALYEQPDADNAAIRARVLKFLSDPTRFDQHDSTSVPTHATGAAIDLTLQHTETDALAEMGAGFDEMSERAASDYYERALETGEVAPNDPRLLHRRLLHWAMGAEGFVNYPPEFWHFDWGNQATRCICATSPPTRRHWGVTRRGPLGMAMPARRKGRRVSNPRSGRHERADDASRPGGRCTIRL